jgi:hypothetical protein
MSYAESGSDPVKIMQDMSGIEDQLNDLLGAWPDAEARLVSVAGRLKLEETKLRVHLKGWGTVPEITAEVERQLWEKHPKDMATVIGSEATIAACKARYKLLDRQLSSLQSRLGAERDLGRVPPNMGRSYA